MRQITIYLSWLISAVAMAGSLYFSNVLLFPPCSLCWWQRIFMYPLTLLFMIAFIKRDTKSHHYTLPLIVCGWIVSIYHNLLYYNVIEKSIIPCTSGVSCTSVQIEWAGFITIPLLSLTAFTLLIILSIVTILNKGNAHE